MDQKLVKEAAGLIAKEMMSNNKEYKSGVMPNPMREDMQRKLESSQTVTCTSCEHYTFIQVTILKRMSALVSPTGEEVIIPVQTFECNRCGNINNDFLPKSAIADIASKINIPRPAVRET
jgi:hypothetical protein